MAVALWAVQAVGAGTGLGVTAEEEGSVGSDSAGGVHAGPAAPDVLEEADWSALQVVVVGPGAHIALVDLAVTELVLLL